MVKLTIDGVAVEVREGTTVLEAAALAGVEIPNLCAHPELAPYGACGVCVVEVENCPKLLRACATRVAEGMIVRTRGERAERARRLALELMMGDHDGDCVGPCRLECPAHTDVQRYVREIAEGRYADAVRTIRERIPFPASIGRVCPHPCERACRRCRVEGAVSIARLKAFAADRVRAEGMPVEARTAANGKSVGVVGGGPAGLSAAYRLALGGFAVTVYDQMPEMGGMLRYGIPEYRLPKAVLRAETDAVAAAGVEFRNGFKVGREATLDELRARHDALIVANGAWRSSPLKVPGENLAGVWGGIDFLRAVASGERPKIGARVAVVGGGNTAMDACRTAVRLGASEVSVIYRRTRAEMPAEADEVAEAEEEGVVYRFLRNPAEILGEGGRVAGVKLQVMELGAPDERGRRRPVPVEGVFETLPLDTVIVAVGQRNDSDGFGALPTTARGTIAADERSFATALDGVFACGDAVNAGAGIAVTAIGEANAAAAAVERYLTGAAAFDDFAVVSTRKPADEEFASVPRVARTASRVRPAAERRADFGEVALPLGEAEARAEAARCLGCGCHDYASCRLIRLAKRMNVDVKRLGGAFHPGEVETRLVSIERDSRKCIGCNLCVRVCEEKAGRGLLGLVGRGFTTVIRPEFRDPAAVAGCATCGKCVEACPTGALRMIKEGKS